MDVDTPTTKRALPPEGETEAAQTRSVPRPSGVAGPGSETAPARRPESRPRPSAPPAGRSNGRPSGPAEMRREIEQTRARMSSTLDAIEARIEYQRRALDRQKQQVVDKVTLKATRKKLSREPWRSIAIAFVAGYVVAAIRD